MPANVSRVPFGWFSRPEGRELLGMVGRIGVIIFAVEAMIMLLLLRGANFNGEVIAEGLLDATLLTLLSSPIIYKFVAEPFATAASEAKTALAVKIDVQAEQAAKLEEALLQSRRLLEQNEALRRHLQKSNRQIGQINEDVLQKVGADLHDGPAQLLTYALLRLRKLEPTLGDENNANKTNNLHLIRSALTDVLTEIRNLSAGLSLPQLSGATLEETARLAATMHEGYTGTHVAFSIENPPTAISQALKICIYRFIQEALTNANRHAKGRGQKVLITGGATLTVTISDTGRGFDPDAPRTGLGLTGMRARIEALGGQLSISSSPGNGTRLGATFPETSVDLAGNFND